MGVRTTGHGFLHLANIQKRLARILSHSVGSLITRQSLLALGDGLRLNGYQIVRSLPAGRFSLSDGALVAVKDRKCQGEARREKVVGLFILVSRSDLKIRILPRDLKLQIGFSGLVLGERLAHVEPIQNSLSPNLLKRERRQGGELLEAFPCETSIAKTGEWNSNSRCQRRLRLRHAALRRLLSKLRIDQIQPRGRQHGSRKFACLNLLCDPLHALGSLLLLEAQHFQIPFCHDFIQQGRTHTLTDGPQSLGQMHPRRRLARLGERNLVARNLNLRVEIECSQGEQAQVPGFGWPIHRPTQTFSNECLETGIIQGSCFEFRSRFRGKERSRTESLRWRAAGQGENYGRTDEQVKIEGVKAFPDAS